MVNAGPLKIGEIFLAPGSARSKKYPIERLNELMDAMLTLVKMCGFAIALNKSLIDETHAKFHAMVTEFYAQLREKVNTMTEEMRKEISELTK